MIKEDFIIISVVSPEHPEYVVPSAPHLVDVLYLRFHDVKDGHVHYIYPPDPENIIEFDNTHAMRIKDFMLKHKDINKIIINCEVGVSRSAGIATALNEIYNGSSVVYLHDPIHHNKAIKEQLINTFGE